MRKFIAGGGTMFLTFALGLAANSLVNDLANVVERWLESPEPVLEEPYPAVLAEQHEVDLSGMHCGLLLVEIKQDRSLWLRGNWIGSLQAPSRLVATLSEVFANRIEGRVYRSRFELDSAVPEDQRIEKTVLIKADRTVSYGEVSDLIEVIRAVGAKPIGLLPNEPFTRQQGPAGSNAGAVVYW